METPTQQPTDSALVLTDINSKKKIFHLVMNIILLIFSTFLFIYHVVMGLIWLIHMMYGYGLSDVLMFCLNFMTLSIAITGVLSLAHEKMNISYRYTLLKFNVAGCMMGLPFLSVIYFFISITEYAHSVNNKLSYIGNGFLNDGINYAHCTLALFLSIFTAAIAIASSISGFQYYQYFDEFRLEKSKQQHIQSNYTTTSVTVQQ